MGRGNNAVALLQLFGSPVVAKLGSSDPSSSQRNDILRVLG